MMPGFERRSTIMGANHNNDLVSTDSPVREPQDFHRGSIGSAGHRHRSGSSNAHHHNFTMGLSNLASPTREGGIDPEIKLRELEKQIELLREYFKEKDGKIRSASVDGLKPQNGDEINENDQSDADSLDGYAFHRTDDGEIVVNPFPYLEKDLKLNPEPLRLPWSDVGTRPEEWDTSKEDKHVVVVFKERNTGEVLDESSSYSLAAGLVVSELPQSIQINSYHLAMELKRIIGVSLDRKPLRLYPPFKYTSTRRDDIEKAIHELEEQLVDGNNQDRESNPGSKLSQKRYSQPFANGIQPIPEVVKIEKLDELAAHISTTAKVSVTADRTRVKEAQRQRMVIKYLKVLLEVIDKDLRPLLQLRNQISLGQVKQVSFLTLWHLYSPGTIVFRNRRHGDGEPPQAFRVHFVTGGRPLTHGERARAMKADSELNEVIADPDQCLRLVIDCHEIRYDRIHFGPRKRTFEIAPFEDMINITDLEIYPAVFHEQYEQVLERLTTRGKRFRSLTQVSFKTYSGLTLDDPEEIQGEVVIDWKTGWSYEERFREGLENLGIPALSLITIGLGDAGWGDTGCSVPDCKVCGIADHDREYDMLRYKSWLRENSSTMKLFDAEKEFIPETLYSLMPKEVIGYYFKGRSWHLLNVDLVKDNDQELQQQGFEDLVLDPKHKDLLKALVENHSAGKRPIALRDEVSRAGPAVQMDLVRGKGKGLIILLHGAPGVGKTLTAETIAAYTRRPLYPITCGDLGQTPGQIEKQLRHHFKLAHKWAGVLLLDEADVFLGKRDRNDIHRNGLVSVFLRELEYYSGILFLTTNQVGVLDEAFKSRIHVSLYYPNFDELSTLELWRKNLARLRARGLKQALPVPVQFNEEKILKFAQQHYSQCKRKRSIWNGRQVHNAFQTAIALAEWEREKRIREGRLQGKLDIEIKDFDVIKLKLAHFQQVSDIAHHFDSYMTKVRRGKDEGEDAYDAGKRFDYEQDDNNGDGDEYDHDQPVKMAQSKFQDNSPYPPLQQHRRLSHYSSNTLSPTGPSQHQQQNYFQNRGLGQNQGQYRQTERMSSYPNGQWPPLQYQQQQQSLGNALSSMYDDERDARGSLGMMPPPSRSASREPPTQQAQLSSSIYGANDDDDDDDDDSD